MAPKRKRVSKSSSTNNDQELSSTSKWIYETLKGSHEFKVEGYSLAKRMGIGAKMTSEKFRVGGYKWVIVFCPNGHDEASEEYISVHLKLVSSGEVMALISIILLDPSGKGIHHRLRVSSKSPTTFKRMTRWGWKQYMKRSEFETSRYLKDDCLSIRCTVHVVQTRVEKEKHHVIHVPPSDMIQNFKGLLESQMGSDITFEVGDELFRAHNKSILAARSPVFKAMFFGLAGNADIETVAIKEFDPFAFRAMLLFLYSDELPEVGELSDWDSLCTSTTIAQHLLAAADRFGLARLKLMCEEKLSEEITANTVATTLVLAARHQCLELKTFCLNFAAKPENLEDVMKSDGYADLEKSLLTDLLKISAAVDKK